MKTCNKYNKKHLLDYLQNRLEDEENDELQFHFLQCDSCRRSLENLRRLDKEVEEDIHAYLTSAKTDAIKEPATRTLFWRITASIALLVGLSIGGYFLMQKPDDGDDPGRFPQNGHNSGDTIPGYPKDSLSIEKQVKDSPDFNADSLFIP